MLENYKDEQKIVVRILENAIQKNKCSHAYLFETNGYKNKEQFALAFAKSLFCPNYNNKNCVNCTICENIDKNIYSELKIIRPDGMWIKKEQLVDLQKDFRNKSLENNKKVYIIYNAEKLNPSAANSILKFLEEPEEGIIAILVTDNIHQLLDTIISRCQIISFSREDLKKEQSKMDRLKKIISLNVENFEQIVENSILFINYYEKNKLDTILNTKSLFLNIFTDKILVECALEIMILYYKEAIHLKLNKENELFENQELVDITNNNTIEQLNYKINVIMTSKKNIKVNANTNLLIDKMIIDLGGELND